MSIEILSPTSSEVLESFEELSPVELERKLAAAAAAFPPWRDRAAGERAELLLEAAAALERRRDELATRMAHEMGKPVTQGLAEVEKCARAARFYAENAVAFLAPEPRESDGTESFVRYDPLGPVLAIMPWNFPFWQVIRFAAPALAAGNVALLKHASNVTGCALAIEEVFREAGFPPGTFQTLVVGAPRVADIIADPRVRAVTLTGSDRTGRKVAEAAGRHLKKVVLELGGSDPFVVLEDADVERAARIGVEARTINSGQSCIAAKRFIVHKARYAEFERRFVERMEALVVGDPLDPRTEVGPLAREDLRGDLARLVEESVRQGAKVLCGGEPLARPGFYYAPTALGGVRPGMPVVDEETFGPVAALMQAADDEDAIALANASRYGLGASLWTGDLEKGRRLAARTEAGCVFINGLVRSDPRLPFGGIKDSGYGRELSREGMLEFVNVKTVRIEPPGGESR